MKTETIKTTQSNKTMKHLMVTMYSTKMRHQKSVDDLFGLQNILPPILSDEGDPNNGNYAGDFDDSNATVEYDVEDMDQENAITNPDSNEKDNDDDDDCMLFRCKTIPWRCQPLPLSQEPLCNILPDGIRFDSIAGPFHLFFNDDMVKHILLYTNMPARETEK